MNQIRITGWLELARVFDSVAEQATENLESVHLAAVNFNLGAAVIQRNTFEGSTEISIAVKLTGRSDTFACLFLDVPSAKALAEKLREMTA
jgi:hypothetical protein